MKQTMDDQVHFEAWQDTPISPPDSMVKKAHGVGNPDFLLDVPGVHLKSKETRHGGMSVNFGKLTSYSDDKVVVMSKVGSVGHRCIWEGTAAEYRAMWRVD